MKFHSTIRNHILQDAEGVWAEFKDHIFETSDRKVAARVKALPGVEQVPGGEPEPAAEPEK